MTYDLQGILNRLNEAKEQRGRLTQIAQASGVSYRTIYGLMHPKEGAPKISAATYDKLAAHFDSVDKKLEQAQ